MGFGDKDQVHTVVADVVQVKASRDEFMLLFGRRKPGSDSAGQVHAALEKLVLMNPSAAKRLSVLLMDRLRELESAGNLPEGIRSVRERLMPTPRIQPPPFRSEKAVDKARLAVERLQRLNAAPAFERSFKIKKGTLLQNRFLVGFEKDSIGPDAGEKVLQLCEQMEMPPDLMASFIENLPEANIVGFGFGENETTCIVKAYLEFGIRYYRAMQEKPDRPDPYLSHLGYKWDVDDPSRMVVTRYSCYPAYRLGDMLENLSGGIYKDSDRSPYETVKSILELASSRTSEDKFLFLAVGEEKNPRNSFDVNVYPARLKVSEIAGELSDIFRFYSVSDEQFKRLYDTIRNQSVGHIAGGIGRDGQNFLTLYCGD